MCDSWCTVPCGPQGAFGVRERLRAALLGHPAPWGQRGVGECCVFAAGTCPCQLCLGRAPSSCQHPGNSWLLPAAMDQSGEEPSWGLTGRMELVMAAEQAQNRRLLPWDVACSELAIRQRMVGNGPEAPTLPQPSAPLQDLWAAGGCSEVGAGGRVISPPALCAEGGSIPAHMGRRREVSPECWAAIDGLWVEMSVLAGMAALQAEGREKLIPGGCSAISMDLSGNPQGCSHRLPLHSPF